LYVKALHAQEVIQLHSIDGGHIVSHARCNLMLKTLQGHFLLWRQHSALPLALHDPLFLFGMKASPGKQDWYIAG
jgi:hypothetical protein